jgi:hypothetical protein
MATKKEKVFNLEFFRKHGAAGGKIGGKKASENMTPEQRSERAKNAVAARKWHLILTEKEKAKLPPKRKVGRPRKVSPPA